jgi:ferrous iron transport protein A
MLNIAHPAEEQALGALSRGECGTVTAVVEDGESLGDAQASTIARRLLELGFVPGARVEVIARMWPAYDPIAVRVGGSTFALRRHEANAIRVRRHLGGV